MQVPSTKTRPATAAEPAADLARFRSVLIVKPSSLGDIVHALPAVAALRETMPGAVFRWLANREWTPLLEGAPVVDEVIPFPRRDFRGSGLLLRFPGWLRGWRRLPREEPELVVDLQGLLRSGIVSRARGANWVAGMSDSREGARFFHDQRVAVDPGAHAVDRCLAVARALGAPTPAPGAVEFPLPAGRRPAGWPAGARVVALHPFSRGRGKALSADALGALIRALGGAPVVLLGVNPDPLPFALPPTVTDLTGRTTLGELIWCLREAAAVISVDSGPMHLAAAVNPRALGIHTWSDPRQVGPYPASAVVWKAGRIAPWRELPAGVCETTEHPGPAAAAKIAAWALDAAGA
jgi:heptosyltransferase-1